MKLYYAPGSCALSCHILLEQIGEPYQAISVKYGDPEFLKINPLGAVPALVDGDHVLAQNSAILKYLTLKYPNARLGSIGDLMDDYQLNYWSAFLTGDLHPAYFPVFVPNRYTDNHDEENLNSIRAAGKKQVDKYLKHLDHHLQGKEHIIGDRPSFVDAYAFAIIRWSMPLDNWPNLKRFADLMLQDKSVQKAMKVQGLT